MIRNSVISEILRKLAVTGLNVHDIMVVIEVRSVCPLFSGSRVTGGMETLLFG